MLPPVEECLELADGGVHIAEPQEVVVPGELDEPGSGDVVGEVASSRQRIDAVTGPMQHQGRDMDRLEHGPNVGLRVHGLQRQGCAGTHAMAKE